MQVTRKFLETIINYSHLSSKDETRPQLNAVAIELQKDHINLIATNGHVMIYSKHDIESNEHRNLLFPNNKAKSLDVFLKYHRHEDTFNFRYLTVDSSFSISTNDGNDYVVYRSIQREFPNWRRIVPQLKREMLNICFDADFITLARKAITGTKKVKQAVRFNFTLAGQWKPMRAVCEYNDIEHNILLMPVRTNEEVAE